MKEMTPWHSIKWKPRASLLQNQLFPISLVVKSNNNQTPMIVTHMGQQLAREKAVQYFSPSNANFRPGFRIEAEAPLSACSCIGFVNKATRGCGWPRCAFQRILPTYPLRRRGRTKRSARRQIEPPGQWSRRLREHSWYRASSLLSPDHCFP